VKPLTIFLHDYAGHPFQVELSRALAQRGHTVVHAYFADDVGPKGDLQRREDDPDGLSFLPISIGEPYSKTSFVKRRFQDVRYGKVAAEAVKTARPDIIISGNTPTESQTAIQQAGRALGAKFVFWCQDFYSIAVSRILSKKLPVVGDGVGLYYTALERSQMRNSDAIVLITDDFVDQTRNWGVPHDRLHVIPNWGAIDQIPLLAKDNPWSRDKGLADKFVFLYSGTIGLKHNPGLLVALAEKYAGNPDIRIVVAAAGSGVAHLEAEKAARKLDNLILPGLQPFAQFPQMLASADVLTAVIERDAGAFSVPSKVLSYLCAGRPILLAAPPENLAAKTVTQSDAGTVVAPEAESEWLARADAFIHDSALRQRQGAAGRRYADANFDLQKVTDRFEAVMTAAGARRI
jgi:colanic acid biosynthesis glycosyl transferase WcaI